MKTQPSRHGCVAFFALAGLSGFAALAAPAFQPEGNSGGMVIIQRGGGDGEDEMEITVDGDAMEALPGLIIGGPGAAADGVAAMMLGGGGPMAMGGVLSFPLTKADVQAFGRLLKFAPEQVDAAVALFEGAAAAYSAKQAEAKARIAAVQAEAQESEDVGAMRKLGPIMAEVGEARRAADTGLMTDIKSLLTAEQAPLWARVEMYRRRQENQRSFGMPVSGEKADLFRIVEQMKLPAEAAAKIEPALLAYEIELDAALVARSAQGKAQREAMVEMLKKRDFAGIQKQEMDAYAAALRVRDVHRSYARRIADQLPAPEASAFEARFRKAAFPQVYRERYAGKALSAAEKLADLTKEQGAALAALRAEYTEANTALGARHEAAVEEQEAEMRKADVAGEADDAGGGVRMMMTRSLTRTDEGPMGAVRQARKALEDKTVASLSAILTPAQREQLPPRPGQSAAAAGAPDSHARDAKKKVPGQ